MSKGKKIYIVPLQAWAIIEVEHRKGMTKKQALVQALEWAYWNDVEWDWGGVEDQDVKGVEIAYEEEEPVA